jgi:anti-sigma regulatory factor (Ser/Thr protein kinase)
VRLPVLGDTGQHPSAWARASGKSGTVPASSSASAASAEAVRWAGRATPDAVGVVRQLLVREVGRLGADESLRDRVALAVSESVTNVVLHAYRDDPEPGEVVVELEHRDATLTLSVRDRGMGLVPRLDSPGLGLGLPLMAQLADGFDISSFRGDQGHRGVDVRLQFAL